MKNLPIIIQSIVYRKNSDHFEVLILKRNEDRGGFWSVVNGTLEFNESIPECRSRELLEETGIKKVKGWSDEINRFSFSYKDQVIVVLVYAAEIKHDDVITINEEHTEYKWASFEDAIDTVKFDDDKNSLRICQSKIVGSEV